MSSRLILILLNFSGVRRKGNQVGGGGGEGGY